LGHWTSGRVKRVEGKWAWEALMSHRHWRVHRQYCAERSDIPGYGAGLERKLFQSMARK